MRELLQVYLRKIDRTYGFIRHDEVAALIGRRWATDGIGSAVQPIEEATLCGIAALGLLFSQERPNKAEANLAESARKILEPVPYDSPNMTSMTAWALRVVYLRITDTHHAAWMASCTLMHMIEAAGFCREPGPADTASSGVDMDLCRRLVAVARHLNMWMSFDMGRSGVNLRTSCIGLPSRRAHDQTSDLMDLLPFSAMLDPQECPGSAALEAALLDVIGRLKSLPSHGHAAGEPIMLGHLNLAMCLSRRLQASGALLSSPKVLEPILDCCSLGVRAAQATLDDRAPWHHVANVPFQIICLLLAVDHHASTPCLKAAMVCLANVTGVYDTAATREALRTATSLIHMQIRWKEGCIAELRSTLTSLPGGGRGGIGLDPYPPDAIVCEGEANVDPPDALVGGSWLNDLSRDLSTLPFLDFDEFLSPGVLAEQDNPM